MLWSSKKRLTASYANLALTGISTIALGWFSHTASADSAREQEEQRRALEAVQLASLVLPEVNSALVPNPECNSAVTQPPVIKSYVCDCEIGEITAQTGERMSEGAGLNSPAPAPQTLLKLKRSTQQATSKQNPQSPLKSKPLSPANTDHWEFVYFLDNDNLGMGLIKSGDDLGFTHSMGLGAQKKSGKNEFALQVSSSLYSTPVTAIDPYMSSYSMKETAKGANGEILHEATIKYPENRSGQPQPQDIYRRMPGQESKQSVRIVDVSQLVASWKRGEDFCFKGVVGIEQRKRTPGIAANLQDTWHGDLLNIYQFDYVSPSEAFPEISYEHSNVTKNTFNYPDGSVYETVLDVPHIIREPIKAENIKQSIATYSALGGASVGAKTMILSGRCTASWEAGVLVSTEGKKVIGPHSNLNVQSKVGGTVLRTKQGNPRMTAGVGAAALVYPSRGPASKKYLGFSEEIEVATYHGGKRSGLVTSPFLIVRMPHGRQVFEEFNDHDAIMRMGVKFILPPSKKASK